MWMSRGSLSGTKAFPRLSRLYSRACAGIEMAAVKSPAAAPELESAAVAIKDFGSGIADEWEHFIVSNPQATPFHSTAWMRALQTTFNYENRSVYAERTGRISGVLPLF